MTAGRERLDRVAGAHMLIVIWVASHGWFPISLGFLVHYRESDAVGWHNSASPNTYYYIKMFLL